MEFTLEPGTKPWAAVVRLTPAMLACLEGQPGAGYITLLASDNVRPNTHDTLLQLSPFLPELFSSTQRAPPLSSRQRTPQPLPPHTHALAPHTTPRLLTLSSPPLPPPTQKTPERDEQTLKVGDNSFNLTCIPEDVPGDLVRGSLDGSASGGSHSRRSGSCGGGPESIPDASDCLPIDAGVAPRRLEVAGSLQCRLAPKRVLAGSDGLAARVKRRVEEKVAEKGSRKAVMVGLGTYAIGGSRYGGTYNKSDLGTRK
jgi:hypothetical protein